MKEVKHVLASENEKLKLEIENLHKEKSRLENLIDTTKIVAWEWEVKTGNLRLDGQWTEMTGYILEDLDPISINTWIKLAHPDDLIKSNKMLELVFSKDMPYYEIEVRVKHKNGNWIWVLNRGKVLTWNSDGSPLLMFGSLTDISMLKDVCVELNTSKDLLQTCLKSFKGVIILSIDKNYCYHYFNEYHSQIMKKVYNQDIEIGMNILDCITIAEDRDKIKNFYERALSGESYTVTEVYGDEKKIYFEASYSPVYNENKEIIGVKIFAQDITSKVKQTERLKHSENLLNYVIDHIKTGIAIHDKDLKYLSVSKKYLSDLHIEDKNIIGKYLYDVFPDLPQKWIDSHARSLKGEVVKEDRDCQVLANGTKLYTRWETRPWYNEDGSIGGIVIDSEVINKQVELESQLKYMSYHDYLTGLYNRRYLFDNIELLWRQSIIESKAISFILIDIDDFKLYNDSFGHIEGDHALIKVATALLASLTRPLDIIGRYGGEEFLAVLPDTSIEGAYKVAENIREKIARIKVVHSEKSNSKVLSVSLGITSVIPDKNSKIEEAIKQADTALFYAKEKGKNRTEKYLSRIEI